MLLCFGAGRNCGARTGLHLVDPNRERAEIEQAWAGDELRRDAVEFTEPAVEDASVEHLAKVLGGGIGGNAETAADFAGWEAAGLR